jgi:HK97 family phage portal protein
MGLLSKLKSYFANPLEEEQRKKVIEVQVSEAFSNTYDAISVISRCVDLIVDTAATIDFKVVQDVGWFDVPAKHNQFEKILDNPSPFFGKFDFYRNVYRDLIFSGNAFPYNLGDQLQLLEKVSYVGDDTANPFIMSQLGDTKLEENRLVHVRLLPEHSRVYGKSYLTRIDKELDLIATMLSFQKNMFRNGAIPGVILSSDNPLTLKQKERIAEEFLNMYSIIKGQAGKPFIADNNLQVETLQHSLKDLQFNEGVEDITKRITAALGVPDVLLTSGNNANILPNYKLFVFNTVYPLVLNFANNLTVHFHKFYRGTTGLKVVPNLERLPLLADDQLKISNSIKTLVTTGIITPNEARLRLHYLAHEDSRADDLMFPQNITGANFESSPGTSTTGEE